jgi:hypothetical protein
LVDALTAYRAVPARAGVGRVVYRQEAAFGLGPGGNESGVIVYSVSDKTIEALNRDAFVFLRRLPVSKGCSQLSEWHETPLAFGNQTGADADDIKTFTDYLNRNGFGIRVPSKIKQMLDQSFVTPGSFYAYGGCGGDLFIFMPKYRRAALVYSG